MADLGNFRGLAVVKVIEAAGERHYSLSIVNVDPSAAPANQATWEGDPGTSLILRLERLDTGAPANQAPTSVQVMMRLPGGAAVGDTWDSNPASGDANATIRTLHFDDNPLNEVLGAIRSGLLEMYVNVRSVGGVQPWNADSRGANAGLLAGTTHDHAEGRLRAPLIVSSEVISNAALGGAEPSLFAYPDSIFSRVMFSAVAYEAFSLELELLSAAAAVEREQTLSASGVNRDYSWTTAGPGVTARVGDDMVAASEQKDLRLKIPTNQFGGDEEYVFASVGHDASWVRDSELQMTAADRITLDPRNTASHHFQVDDNVFALAADVSSRRMLNTQSGFLWTRMINARGEGQNGITMTISLDPDKPGTTESNSFVASTQAGQAGWAGPLDWTASKPAGFWQKASDITAPSDADSDAHFFSSGEANYVMLIVDPDVRSFVYMHNVGATDEHFHRGNIAKITAFARRQFTGKRIGSVDGVTNPRVALIRFDHPNDRFEQLVDPLDNTSAAWQVWRATDALTFHSVTEDLVQKFYSLTFTATGGWDRDIRHEFAFELDGTPYTTGGVREEVLHHSQIHSHDGVDGSGTVAHADTTGQTPDDHHPQSHNLDSHSDVDITGAQDGDALVFDGTGWVDGDPDCCEEANADGHVIA